MADVKEQAKQQEKDNADRAAAVVGAKAVADSIKKAADAAVEGAEKSAVSSVPGDFLVSGTPGGRFELRAKSGPIFSSSGSVFVNGKPQHIDEWGATYIRGKFDADVQSGEVTVPIDEKTIRRGYLKVA